MRSIFVDTGYVLAYVTKSDQYHEQALKLSQKYQNNQMVITEAVILEIGNALSRIYKTIAIGVIERFYKASNITILKMSPDLFQKGFALYKLYQDKTWGLVDCISFVVMREVGITHALTFDQHFVQAGFKIAQ